MTSIVASLACACAHVEPPAATRLVSPVDDASVEMVSLMKQHGIAARCVGFCGSALAEILLGSGRCIVTPQGQVMPHLAFVPHGTQDQTRIAEIETVVWWVQTDLPLASRPALLDNLTRSPTKAWLMRSDELRAAGCAT